MLSFDYTIDIQLEDTLRTIDRFRSEILTLPEAPGSELKLQWEGAIIRTWATLALAGHDIPKHHVATILAHPTKPTRGTAMIYAIRNTYDYIHLFWRANPKSITLPALETICTMLTHQKTMTPAVERDLKDLLTFLDTERAHPVVQASVAHVHILTMPDLPDAGVVARMVHYLLLSKYGYDLRGYISPDRIWLENSETYRRLTRAYTGSRHMTTWLSFMAESMRQSLGTLLSDIQESHFHIEFPKSFWLLSDRQKDLIKLLEPPGSSMTNKKAQKHFRISQVTASRDLSRLANLGLVYPHGKGRSVYYTKI